MYQMPTHQFAIFNIPSYKSETDAGRGEKEKTHPSHLPVTYEINGWENYDKRFFFFFFFSTVVVILPLKRGKKWRRIDPWKKRGREETLHSRPSLSFLLFGAQCGVIASDTQLSPAHVFQLSFPFYWIFCVQEVAAVVVTAVTVTDRIRPGQLLARFRTNFAVQWEREKKKKKEKWQTNISSRLYKTFIECFRRLYYTIQMTQCPTQEQYWQDPSAAHLSSIAISFIFYSAMSENKKQPPGWTKAIGSHLATEWGEGFFLRDQNPFK